MAVSDHRGGAFRGTGAPFTPTVAVSPSLIRLVRPLEDHRIKRVHRGDWWVLVPSPRQVQQRPAARAERRRSTL